MSAARDFNKEHQKAFTLAEALIVLGIIGVVAVLVIPTLIKNTQDQEYKVQFKKTYSLLNQAFLYMKEDCGGSVKGCTIAGGGVSRDLLASHLKVVDICDTPGVGACWAVDRADLKLLGGGSVDGGWGPPLGKGMALADGSFVFVRDDVPDCSLTSASTSWGMGTNPVCSEIWVDTNGKKGPNTVGKDVFLIFLAENRLIPAGASHTSISPANTCSGSIDPATTTATPASNTVNTGYGCAAKYLFN